MSSFPKNTDLYVCGLMSDWDENGSLLIKQTTCSNETVFESYVKENQPKSHW